MDVLKRLASRQKKRSNGIKSTGPESACHRSFGFTLLKPTCHHQLLPPFVQASPHHPSVGRAERQVCFFQPSSWALGRMVGSEGFLRGATQKWTVTRSFSDWGKPPRVERILGEEKSGLINRINGDLRKMGIADTWIC